MGILINLIQREKRLIELIWEIGKEAAAPHIRQGRGILVIFLVSTVFMFGLCSTVLLPCGLRVALSDIDVLCNCLSSTGEHQALAVSASRMAHRNTKAKLIVSTSPALGCQGSFFSPSQKEVSTIFAWLIPTQLEGIPCQSSG